MTVHIHRLHHTSPVRHAVQKMKLRKSAGPDDLVAEHLRYGGGSIITWLTEILNSVLDVESLKTIPVYKGGGKDPLDVNSYRGITLNSVISKVLELLILERLDPLFTDAGLPHPNQSAYRRNVSCADAIFATQTDTCKKIARCTCACMIFRRPSTRLSSQFC